MTTERIDVLAVLEASAKRLRLGVEGPANADALDEARAAIAELIEAAGAIAEEGAISASLVRNLRNALARVGAP